MSVLGSIKSLFKMGGQKNGQPVKTGFNPTNFKVGKITLNEKEKERQEKDATIPKGIVAEVAQNLKKSEQLKAETKTVLEAAQLKREAEAKAKEPQKINTKLPAQYEGSGNKQAPMNRSYTSADVQKSLANVKKSRTQLDSEGRTVLDQHNKDRYHKLREQAKDIIRDLKYGKHAENTGADSTYGKKTLKDINSVFKKIASYGHFKAGSYSQINNDLNAAKKELNAIQERINKYTSDIETGAREKLITSKPDSVEAPKKDVDEIMREINKPYSQKLQEAIDSKEKELVIPSYEKVNADYDVTASYELPVYKFNLGTKGNGITPMTAEEEATARHNAAISNQELEDALNAASQNTQAPKDTVNDKQKRA